MKIAFVSGNREKLPDAVVPLGMLYVMASTPERHARQLVDLCFERYPIDALRSALTELRPDVIALGMRNIQNNAYSGVRDTIAYYASLIDTARQVGTAPIVLGGAGFSVMPARLMERLRPDYGISGEAEHAFPALVEALEGDRALASVPSLHWFESGRLISSPPPQRFLDLDALQPPDRSQVDPRYYARYATDSIQTKRGCPLRCDYCTYPTIEGRIGRARGAERVVNEMFAALEQHPETRHFFIVDSVFNLPKTHAKNVCRELIERGWKIPWTCYANPLGFDAEMAKLAREAGCTGMEIGSDSGCDHVLESLRKGFTTRDIRRIRELCAEAGVPDCHTFILGTRGETLDDVRRTLDFAADLDPFSVVFMIWVDDQEALDPALREERAQLREAIAGLLRERCPEKPNWSAPPLAINFDKELFRRMRRAGRHGPLWQHMRAVPPRPGTHDR